MYNVCFATCIMNLSKNVPLQAILFGHKTPLPIIPLKHIHSDHVRLFVEKQFSLRVIGEKMDFAPLRLVFV